MSKSEPPQAKTSPIVPGYQLDRYEMLSPIAEGGMASVWVARLRGKRGFEKLVAIKTILPKYAQDPRFERMFLDEAALASRIEHNNVAQVLDLGEEHEVLYLAMELVDGDALSKLLRVVDKKGQKIPTGIVLRILADTCGGLHAAHEVRGRDGGLLNVVHRDVSPQNILITMGGVAKLIDFGIAKARDRVSEDTSEGMLKGKIHFMAPEQALGRKIDRRADIFAVGAILYFILSGKPPYAGENEIASLFLLSSGRPPLPLPASVHPAVSEVLKRALAHDPEVRFATAEQMQAALEAAMVTAGLATTTATVSAFVQEHMADRARRRKEGMDMALSAAAQREKVARILEKAGHDSASGHGVTGAGVSGAASSGPVSSVEATYATVLLGPPSRDPARDLLRDAARESQSEPSQATLGSASAMASPVPEEGEFPTPRKFGALVAAVVAIPAIAVAVGLAVHSGNRPRAVAGPPPVTANVVSRPSIPPVPSDTPSASAPAPDWTASPPATGEPSGEPSSKPVADVPSAPVIPWPNPKRPVVTTAPPVTPKPPTSSGSTRVRVNDGF
ncbi:MAG: protein kinase domain-containing protein [Polyangiaceae bacterium]